MRSREARAPREAGAVGVLVAARPDCRVELLALPDLTRTPVEACGGLAGPAAS